MQEGIVYNLNWLILIQTEVEDTENNFLNKRVSCKFGVHICLLDLSMTFVQMFLILLETGMLKIQAFSL